MAQPDVSNVMRGRLSGYSVERLTRLLNALGRDVEIRVKPRRAARARGHLRVTASSAGRVRETTAPPYGPTIDRAVLAAVCRRHHIRWLAMFGSTARGEAGPGSNVDLVADFEPGMTPGLGIIRVAEALRPAFGGRPVDLVTRRGLSPRLRDRVMAQAVPLHGA